MLTHTTNIETVQDYSPQKRVEGVQIVDLPVFGDESGLFTELGRFDGGFLNSVPEFEVRQVNFSTVMPGSVKAWHIHYNQEDVWYVPPQHRLLVGLHDVRSKSATRDVVMRFVLGGAKNRLLVIPRGVAHGCANLSPTPVTLIYFVNQHFDPDNPDEQRLPWDYLGGDFWDMHKG